MSEMNNIWILNHYAGTAYLNRGGRHYWFAKYLKRYGYNPTVFCCNKIHNTDSFVFDNDNLVNTCVEESTGVPYVFIKGRDYKGNGKDRILNMIDFFRNLKKCAGEYAKKCGTPDIIYASSVHPLTLLAGIKLAKKFGVKCVCEVRDLWPESIVVYMKGIKRNNPLVRLLYCGEKYLYKKADALIFTMEGGYEYIIEKGWNNCIPKSKVYYINNGVDLEQFKRDREEYKISDQDLENENTFKVIYSGSIRRANNLDKLLDVAKELKEENIVFLIFGDGEELHKLLKRVDDEEISNVIFKGKVDKKFIPFITTKADLNIVHNEESSLFKYGISFNKLFEYMAAGRPILCDFHAEYNPVVICKAGTECLSSYPHEIANELKRFKSMEKEELERICASALKASEQYDFRNLTLRLVALFNDLNMDRAPVGIR